MQRVDFGYTWWGKKWLDSLTSVDFDNRLPRGRRYARNGSVMKIEIKNGQVTAKVRGSWIYDVEITAKKFTTAEKKIITNEISKNKLYLSKLLRHELHEGLHDALHRKGIKLFPEGARDLKTYCSCPDSAVTCKHIAAVIYLIANEIDKNPFIVFDLHDFDLAESFAAAGEKVSVTGNNAVQTGPEMLAGIKSRMTDSGAYDNDIDFTKIVKNESSPAALLSSRPLFDKTGDFKAKLHGMYIRNEELLSSALSAGLRQETGISTGDYRDIDIILDDSFRLKKSFLRDGDAKLRVKDEESVIGILENVEKTHIDEYNESIRAHYMCLRFAQSLISRRAYLPVIIRGADSGYTVIWEPARGDKNIDDIIVKINRLFRGGGIGMEVTGGKSARINNPAYTAAVFYLTLMVHILNKSTVNNTDEIEDMFLHGKRYKADTFVKQEIPGTINIWLERLRIGAGSIIPVLKIEESKKCFLAEVMAEKKNEPGNMIPLKTIMADEKYNDFRQSMIKNSGILADAIPGMEAHVASGGEKKARISTADFTRIFFSMLPQLKMLGYGIALPKSLDNILKPRLYMAPVKNKGAGNIKSYFGRGTAYEFDWKIAIGGEMMGAEEFAALAGKYGGLVKFRDSYLYLGEEEINRILKLAGRRQVMEPYEAVKAALSGQIHGVGIELSPDMRRMMDELMNVKSVGVSKSLTATLRQYQSRGYEWLYKNAKLKFGSLIADDMGLGKTVQVIALCLKLKEEGVLKKHPGLIVMPTTLLTNWEKEIGRFAGKLRTYIYHGNERKFEIKNKDLVLTTYGILRREQERFSCIKWPVMAIDEAQTIKNDSSGQAKAVKSIKADIRVAMTGTPVENRLAEYYSISEFLNPGYLGSRDKFIKEYAVPMEAYGDRETAEKFRKITAPFVIRRLKTDKSIINDLPDKVEIDDYCSLTKEQAAVYQAVIDREMKIIEESEGIERRGRVLKLMTELKQICNHPSQYAKRGGHEPEKSGKAAMLMELMDTIHENGEKTLIFTQYTEMGG
ncbi:MAG: DEAD/DEAH box helicase family protein, partial [Spirochaetia bacterium]|nr:DEAD/DEAH box helicase family protein [Spirochaetia bacterium]